MVWCSSKVFEHITGDDTVSRLTETDRNRPEQTERTYENTETDFYGSRNKPERISVGTETDRNRLQLILKRTSMGTRKGRVGYDRNDPNNKVGCVEA